MNNVMYTFDVSSTHEFDQVIWFTKFSWPAVGPAYLRDPSYTLALSNGISFFQDVRNNNLSFHYSY
jgi:hypothetical protein